jgi:hypothetical protein
LIHNASGNTIGGTASGAGNVITGDFYGILITGDNPGTSANDNLVEGNYVGTDPTGLVAMTDTRSGVGVFLLGYASGNTIGGTSPAARNVIAGWEQDVTLMSSGSPGACTGNVVEGNYIGTDATGSNALTGPWTSQSTSPGGGVQIGLIGTSGNTIGGTAAGAGNLISGLAGFAVEMAVTSSNVVEGNLIGTNASGTGALPNGTGVIDGGTNDVIGGTAQGAGNTIASNQGSGVVCLGTGAQIEGNSIHDNNGPGVDVIIGAGKTTGNSIVGNSIHNNSGPGVEVDSGSNSIVGNSIYGNSGLGIDLTGTGIPLLNDSQGHVGANNFQNYPVVTSATSSSTSTSISGTFTEAAEPNTTLTLDFYANPVADPSGYGQGQTYLGSTTVTTDGNGNATFVANLTVGNLGGQWITATATDPGGNTSEFSADAPILAPNETFAQFLQGILPQSSTTANSMTIVAGPSTMPATVIGAVNALTNVTQPVTVTLDLGGGTYSSGGVAANPPPNVTFVVQNGTLDPDNPALTVAGGQVSVLGCTLTTSGNAPTLLVTGGNVTLLNDNIIQASTVFTDPAIAVTGGTVNLGTAAAPGNNTLSVNSSGDLVTNTTGRPISAVGDTFKVGGTVETAPSLSFTSLATSAASSVVGQPVTLTATVGPDMPGSATPTGTIDFYDTTTNTDLGKVTLSGGVASLTTSALGVGTHVIQASYAGDATYLPSLYTINESVTYNITLLSNLSHSQPAGSQFTFQVEPTNAAGTNLSASVGSVTAVGFAPASNPTQITPVPDGGAFTPLPNSKKPTSWQYILQTPKTLASGTYVFYFTIQGDPVTHSLTFQVK